MDYKNIKLEFAKKRTFPDPLSKEAKLFLGREQEKGLKRARAAIERAEKGGPGGRKFSDSFEDYLDRKFVKWSLDKGRSPRRTKKALELFEKEQGRNIQRAQRRYKKAGKKVSLPKSSPYRPKIKREKLPSGKYKKTAIGGLQRLKIELEEKDISPKAPPPPSSKSTKIVDVFELVPQTANFLDQGQLKAIDQFIGGTGGPFIGFKGENVVLGSPAQDIGKTTADLGNWIAGEQYRSGNKTSFPVWQADYIELDNGSFYISVKVTDYIES